MMSLNRHDGLWEGPSGDATMFNFPTDYFTYLILGGCHCSREDLGGRWYAIDDICN